MEDYKFDVGDRVTLISKDDERWAPDMEGDIGTPIYGEVYIISDRCMEHEMNWYSLKGGSHEDDANFDLEKYFEKSLPKSLKELLKEVE